MLARGRDTGDPSHQRGRRQGAGRCLMPAEGGLWQGVLADRPERWRPHSAPGRHVTRSRPSPCPRAGSARYSASPGPRLHSPGVSAPAGHCGCGRRFLQLGAATLDLKSEDYQRVLM